LYESTQSWIRQRGIFDGAGADMGDYADAVIRV